MKKTGSQMGYTKNEKKEKKRDLIGEMNAEILISILGNFLYPSFASDFEV